jgi:hypothetical protein
MSVILDCHAFGKFHGSKLGSVNVTSAMFANLWTQLASEFVGEPAVVGFDIMNEPNNMPSATAWPEAAQAAIDAIRLVDQTTAIYVEGDHWSSSATWEQSNPLLHTLTDKECTNEAFGKQGCIVWSAHCYLDRDNSGTHMNWTAEVEAGVTVRTGEDRLRPFSAWLAKYKYTHAHIGEMGTGRDNDGWLEALNNSMSFLMAADWEITYWSAGPWFRGNYGYDADAETVLVNGTKTQRDAVQMAVLGQYSGSPAPEVYFLKGPTRGHTSELSAPFTLTYRGYITRSIKFSCYLRPAGGSGSVVFTTTCPPGYNCEASFSVNVPAGQPGQASLSTHTVDCKNDAGLTDAPPLLYMSSSDLFIGAAAEAANVFSLRRIYTNYTGPLLTLRRSIDNQTQNFTFGSDGELDTPSIVQWCSSPCSTYVDTWFDQGPNRW